MDYIITYIDFHKRIDSSRGLRRNIAEMHKASDTYGYIRIHIVKDIKNKYVLL